MGNCTTCGEEITAKCDWRQGRCPHRNYLINVRPKDTSNRHFYVSIVKSTIRIVAAGCLISGNFTFAGAGFILAEMLGIVEEMA